MISYFPSPVMQCRIVRCWILSQGKLIEDGEHSGQLASTSQGWCVYRNRQLHPVTFTPMDNLVSEMSLERTHPEWEDAISKNQKKMKTLCVSLAGTETLELLNEQHSLQNVIFIPSIYSNLLHFAKNPEVCCYLYQPCQVKLEEAFKCKLRSVYPSPTM